MVCARVVPEGVRGSWLERPPRSGESVPQPSSRYSPWAALSGRAVCRNQTSALPARIDPRRHRRSSSGVADLPAVDWRGAFGRERKDVVRPRRIRPWFPNARGRDRRVLSGDAVLYAHCRAWSPLGRSCARCAVARGREPADFREGSKLAAALHRTLAPASRRDVVVAGSSVSLSPVSTVQIGQYAL